MRRNEESVSSPAVSRRVVPSRMASRAVVMVACTALAAGCAAVSSTTPVQSPRQASSSPARTTSSTQTPQPAYSTPARPPAGQTPQQFADVDATSILASFAVPPGAVRLPGAPSVGNGLLKQASYPGTPDLVDDVEWWQAPGAPATVLGWETDHLPPRFSSGGTGSGSNGNAFFWSDNFDLPAITGVLNSRGLEVEAVDAGGGKTDLRVDAQVTWIPARPASEVVPSAARAVTLSLLPNINVHTRLPGPVTITDPAQVRAIASLIDGLPEFPPGPYSCPAAFGDALVLTFRAQPGSPALAVATVALSGCEGIDFTIGSREQPGLGGPDQGQPVAARILKMAGLRWKLP